MLHEETVERETLALIRRLTADHFLKDFVLVGGTALSLQLGHRKSIDIDLFTPHPFDSYAMEKHIESTYNPTETQVLTNAVYSPDSSAILHPTTFAGIVLSEDWNGLD
jgi:hypothetical protein